MLLNLPFFGTLPVRGSEFAWDWDKLYIFLVILSIIFCVIVVGAMVVFGVKYHHKRHAKPEYIEGNHLLEAVWTAIPTVLVMIMFVWGYIVYKRMVEAPGDAYEIHAIAKQWSWQFQYDTGRVEMNKLYVPLNRPVKVISTSEDVLHSLFIPNFRVKKDVVPGMYTHIWFEAKVLGEHHLFCAEYCGTAHSGMIGKVVVLGDEDWKAFLRGKEVGQVATQPAPGTAGAPNAPPASGEVPMSLAARGKELFQSRGCVACHSVTGAAGVAPTVKGLLGHEVELADGSKVKADENYIRESIEEPNAKMVKGFQPVMPTFKGQLREDELSALITYIKSLK